MILCPAKLLFKIDGAIIKIFHNKQKLKQYYDHQAATNRRFYKEFCTQKMKVNKMMRGWEASNHKRRKDK
jgi:hypothetical protein